MLRGVLSPSPCKEQARADDTQRTGRYSSRVGGEGSTWNPWELLGRTASPFSPAEPKKRDIPEEEAGREGTKSPMKEAPSKSRQEKDGTKPSPLPPGHKSPAPLKSNALIKNLQASLLPGGSTSKVVRKFTIISKIAFLSFVTSLAFIIGLALLWQHTAKASSYRNRTLRKPSTGGVLNVAFPPSALSDLTEALEPQNSTLQSERGRQGKQERTSQIKSSRQEALQNSRGEPSTRGSRRNRRAATDRDTGFTERWFDTDQRKRNRTSSILSWMTAVRRSRKTDRFHTKAKGCPNLPNPDKEEVIPRHYPNPTNFSRAECSCHPVHNFVILSMQRSGSGWFETFLNNHTNISSFGEILGKSKGRKANLSEVLMTLDKVYNLEWNNSAAKNECTAAVGFKWMLNQGAMAYREAVNNYFLRYHVSVILLVRRNVLRRLISILANGYDRKMRLLDGEHKSHVHSHEEAARLAVYKPRLGVRHLVGNLQRVQIIVDDAIRAFNTTRLKIIAYEDVVRNPQVLVDVQKFLGVPVERLQSRQVKIHTKPLNESIENYEEVAKKLRGSPLEFVLNEGYL